MQVAYKRCLPQKTFTFSSAIVETLEKGVKYVQN